MNQRMVKKVIDWPLFALTLVYLMSGLGITQYRIIEPLTLGLLSKSSSFKMHENLLIPFVTLLTLHILFRPIGCIIVRCERRAKKYILNEARAENEAMRE